MLVSFLLLAKTPEPRQLIAGRVYFGLWFKRGKNHSHHVSHGCWSSSEITSWNTNRKLRVNWDPRESLNSQSPHKLHSARSPLLSPNSTSSWDLSIQGAETVGDVSLKVPQMFELSASSRIPIRVP